MAALLVRHAFLNRRTNTCHQRVQRFDDQEEHSSSDGDEREQIRKEAPYRKTASLIVKVKSRKSGFPKIIATTGIRRLSTNEVMSARRQLRSRTRRRAPQCCRARKSRNSQHQVPPVGWAGCETVGWYRGAARTSPLLGATIEPPANGLKRRMPGCNPSLAVALVPGLYL